MTHRLLPTNTMSSQSIVHFKLQTKPKVAIQMVNYLAKVEGAEQECGVNKCTKDHMSYVLVK